MSPLSGKSHGEKPPVTSHCAPEDLVEVDLSSLLDLQDERQLHEGKRTNKVILVGFGCALASVLVWYAASEGNRRKVDGLIQNVKESRQESQETGGPDPKNFFDQALEKLGTRSTDIDAATRTLHVDPSTVKEDGMDAEMKGMMGGQGHTVGERKRMVEGLAGAVGIHAGKPPSANEAPHPAPPPAPPPAAPKPR